jgi:hypothetical protein
VTPISIISPETIDHLTYLFRNTTMDDHTICKCFHKV